MTTQEAIEGLITDEMPKERVLAGFGPKWPVLASEVAGFGGRRPVPTAGSLGAKWPGLGRAGSSGRFCRNKWPDPASTKERRNAIKAFADLVKGTEGFVVCNCEDCPNCGCGPTTPKKETTP